MPQPILAYGQRLLSPMPVVRKLGAGELRDCLAHGFDDFRAAPTHLVFLGLIYPIVGLLLGRIASGANALPLLYPLFAGFALIGPFAGVGLYEMSREREMGKTIGWRNAFDVFSAPRLPAILMLGAMLALLYVVWLIVAQAIFGALMPAASGATIPALASAALHTQAGRTLILVGTAVGAVFAVAALSLTVVAFPLLLDREVGQTAGEQASIALQTSIRVVRENPVAMAIWGVIVAIGLALGMVTLFVGLAVVVPILAHATWHLYRKLVA